MGATTLLNVCGDTTLVWDESNDDQMEVIIAAKMAAGITFFIVEPRLGGLASPTKSKLEDATHARKHRALAIPDADFAHMVGLGSASLVATPEKPIKAVRKAKTAKEAASAETVGVQQKVGG